MGSRKRESANLIKEEKKNKVQVVLRGAPVSSRKVRLVLDLIRNKDVKESLYILKYLNKEASLFIEKLLLLAISNWKSKNQDADIENSGLYIKEAFAGEGVMLKRIQPAPQGRAHRVRKRRSNINLVLGSKN